MTRKEVEILLQSLSQKLRREIEIAQSTLAEARKLAANIRKLFNNASKLSQKLEHPETGLEAILSSATEKESRISGVSDQAQSKLGEIESALGSVQQNITDMKAAYTEFEATKAKIDDKETGLEAILSSATEKESRISGVSDQAQSKLGEIESALGSVQQNITDMKAAYTEFEATKAKIDDKETGLEATLKTSQVIRDDIDAVKLECETLYKEISRYKDKAAEHSADISTMRAESQKALDEIEQIKSDSEGLRDKVSKIFELVSQSGHANHLDRRKDDLLNYSWLWFGIGTSCIVIAVYLAVKFISPLVEVQAGENISSVTVAIEAILVRLTLITPVIGMAIFAFSNYGKERRLAEEYAFKATSALTVEGSILLLKRSLDGVDSTKKADGITNFAVKTLSAIHREPQEVLHSRKDKFRLGNKAYKQGQKIIDHLEKIIDKLTSRQS